MKNLALISLLLLIVGCARVKHVVVRPVKNPPQLRTRPNISAAHYVVPTYCIKKVEYYQGWCEDGQTPGELLCHDMIIRVPTACIMVKANANAMGR
ncbi:MAG: hypothetical protein M3P27_02990 [Acidobacteriota bacterium]|nr:hypothetical protein [Acidobacteriota bacterium]